jgi:very-short-patch-repair endonuclease
MTKTLSIRTEAKDKPSDPRTGWGVSGKRLDRLKEMARARRRDPSEPEKLLWTELKDQKLGGFRFKRQQIVGSAIVDFACPGRWLVVEVDGDTPANPEVDALRDRKLTEVGIRVLRFQQEEVMESLDNVLQSLLQELQKPFERPRPNHKPSAQRGGVER